MPLHRLSDEQARLASAPEKDTNAHGLQRRLGICLQNHPIADFLPRDTKRAGGGYQFGTSERTFSYSQWETEDRRGYHAGSTTLSERPIVVTKCAMISPKARLR